ncbi:MAG: pyridoxamine 5'-phosphate oxidase family protein [Myxococcota bacterium]
MSEKIQTDYVQTGRTQLKRLSERGRFDRACVHAILDEAFIAHVAVVDRGEPRSIPFVYARSGENLFFHGSVANRLLRCLRDGAEACVSVILVDGLVLARSAFHHSVNYRSVVLYARAEEVVDPDEKMEALRLTVEHSTPGRWQDVRPPNREELLQTLVVKLPIQEVSAKVRTGDPIDDEADHALSVWAGVVPMQNTVGELLPDEQLRDGLSVPASLRPYRRPAENTSG